MLLYLFFCIYDFMFFSLSFFRDATASWWIKNHVTITTTTTISITSSLFSSATVALCLPWCRDCGWRCSCRGTKTGCVNNDVGCRFHGTRAELQRHIDCCHYSDAGLSVLPFTPTLSLFLTKCVRQTVTVVKMRWANWRSTEHLWSYHLRGRRSWQTVGPSDTRLIT